MKRLTVGLLVFAVFAAPCVYDAFSTEPSALAGLLAASVLWP
ncbi:hypothetical protein [Sinorhizobium medicae]|nr:hypothetical protein [Sinorhizobium medicae]